MTKREDGGPAFPDERFSELLHSTKPFSDDSTSKEWNPYMVGHAGMSLRDYFAAAALPEAQRVSANVCKPEEVVSMGVAVAYAWADAMLAAREK